MVEFESVDNVSASSPVDVACPSLEAPFLLFEHDWPLAELMLVTLEAGTVHGFGPILCCPPRSWLDESNEFSE